MVKKTLNLKKKKSQPNVIQKSNGGHLKKPINKSKRVVAQEIQQVKQSKISLRKSGPKLNTNQNSQKLIKKSSHKLVKTQKQKPKRVAKKVLRVVNPMEDEKIQKLLLKQAREQIREQKRRIKEAKAKLWELNPNKQLPEITSNPILQPIQNQKQIKGKKTEYPLPYCCLFCNNRKLIYYLQTNNLQALKECFLNGEEISNPKQKYSVDCQDNFVSLIYKSKNVEALKLYLELIKKQDIKRVSLPEVGLKKQSTGVPNRMQFYFPIRQVKLSRGGKEGNNAFTSDNKLRGRQVEFNIEKVLKFCPTKEMIELDKQNYINLRNGNFGIIVRSGNMELVKWCIEQAKKGYNMGCNRLHFQAILQGDEVKEVKNVKKPSLLKKTLDELQLMPAHIAAVNPDPSVFALYFRAFPTTMQQDGEQRDLVHYAAANQNSDVLEFLIKKKAEVNNQDSKGITPLMIACKLGRIQNVQLLLEEQERLLESLDADQEDFAHYQEFYKFVNTLGPYKNTALHIAVKKGHLNIVKALVENKADLNIQNFYKNTAFSLACERGHLEIAKYLLEKGSNIHGLDKTHKTPLLRACINGHIHIVSFLLREGVSPNQRDISENSALHYACAYGWLNIVQYLVEAGAEINAMNEWKMSPILIAMLKNHTGIVDYLIDLKDLNANFQDDQGRTIITQICLNFNEETFKNLKYLLSKKKIDVTIKDVQGYTAIHYLALNNIHQVCVDQIYNKGNEDDDDEPKVRYIRKKGRMIKKTYYNRYRRYHLQNQFTDQKIPGFHQNQDKKVEFEKKYADLQKGIIQSIELLIQNGLSIEEKSNEKEYTALNLAIQSQNLLIAELLLKHKATINRGAEKQDSNNILHYLAKEFYFQKDLLLNQLIKQDKKALIQMVKEVNDDGMTPYLCFVQELSTLINETLNRYSHNAQSYIKENILSQAFKHLMNITEVFSKELNYDITTVVSHNKQTLEKLEKDYKEELIDMKIKQNVINLILPPSNSKKKEQNKSKLKNFEYDDIESFDPEKQTMYIVELKEKNSNQISTIRRKNTAKMPRKYYKNQKPQQKQLLNEEQQLKEKDYFKMTPKLFDGPIHFLLPCFENEDNFTKKLEEYVQKYLNLCKQLPSKAKDNLNRFNFSKDENILFMATSQEKQKIIKMLIESNLFDLNIQNKKRKYSILHLIADCKNKDIINTIISYTKTPLLQSRDKNQNTPLHYACYYRNTYLVEKLLNFNQIEINARNIKGYTPLHMSLFSFKDNLDHTPQIERLLIDKGSDINAQDNDLRSPLFYLFYKNKAIKDIPVGDPANAIIVLTNAKANLHIKDHLQNTVLHYACGRGSTICALTMINGGAKINEKNFVGNTPFDFALLYNRSDLCIFLIQNNCDIKHHLKLVQYKTLHHQIDKLNKFILPKYMKDKYLLEDVEHPNFKSYMDEVYEVKEKSLFEKAYENNFNNIGYLLLQKNYDQFEALKGCLGAFKYESFNDLLLTVGKSIISKEDEQKRNLLMILVEKLTKCSSPVQIERGVEIVLELNKNYNLSSKKSDVNGQNIFHYIAEFSNLQLFKKFYDAFSKNDSKELVQQVDKKMKIAPIIKIMNSKNIQNLQSLKENVPDLKQFNQNYQQFVDLEGGFDYLNDGYILKDNHFPIEFPNKSYHSTMGHYIVKELSKLGEKSDIPEILKTLIEKGLNIQGVEEESGLNLLQLAIMLNNKFIIQHFLGFVKDPEFHELVQKGQPLISPNKGDKQGRSAFYYAIKPCNYGSWQNLQVIQWLLDVGGQPLQTDKQGMNAFDYAINDEFIYWTLASRVPQGKAKPNKSKPLQIESDDKITELKMDLNEDIQIDRVHNLNYEKDADQLIKQKIKEKEKTKMDVDPKYDDDKVPVDPDVKMDACEVLKGQKDGDYDFDVLMNKVDIKSHLFGIFNFYIIQLLFDKVKNIYILFTKWGRIGDYRHAQNQRTPFENKELAIKEFEKVFKQKSGIKWEEFNQSQHIPGKYRIKRIGGKRIFEDSKTKSWQFSERQISISDLIVNFDNYQLKPSKLSQDEFDFIYPLVDQALLLRQMKGQNIDKNLTMASILDTEIIRQLNELLNKMTHYNNLKQQASKDKDRESVEKYTNILNNLSNEYYEKTDYSFAQFGLISPLNIYQINQERKKLKLILDVESVTKLLLAAQLRMKEMNPYDYCFQALNFKLQKLNHTNIDYKLITKYINNSTSNNNQQNLMIRNIFQIQRDKKQSVDKKEEDNFRNMHNHFMLFHGSSNANILSIIEQGLQIRPINSSAQHGNAYGTGIYFADQAELSLSYTSRHEGKEFYMLVCEVALGNACNITQVRQNKQQIQINYPNFDKNPLPKGFNSLRIMTNSGPNFNNNLVREDKTIWPMGSIIPYGQPVLKEQNQVFSSVKELHEFLNKKPNSTLPKKMKKKEIRKIENEDQEMSDGEAEGEEEYVRDKGKKGKNYGLEPNVISYLPKQDVNLYFWTNSRHAEYVIFNPNQVRVRYVIQFTQSTKD